MTKPVMLSALLYLQYHTFKNRAAVRLKRLKQPKYLLGGIVGALYFYFYFFRHLFSMSSSHVAVASAAPPADLALYESLGALLLLVLVLLAWLVPKQRTALAFSEAEVAFLFPAPISRRGLIHFKLLRSQTRILVTTLLLTLLSNRFAGRAGIHAAGWWLVLSTLNLHMLAASFAPTMLLERGISTWQRRVGVLTLVLALTAVVLVWARRTLPSLHLPPLEDPEALTNYLEGLKEYIRQVLVSGPAPYLLYPFRLLVRPYLAPNGLAFLSALAPALVLMLLHYWWVIRSDVAFEEASVEASRKLAEKVAAIRSGNWQAAKEAPEGRRPPFTLRPAGPQPVALLWKNLISAGQAFTLRLWLVLTAIIISAGVGLLQAYGRSNVLAGLAAVAGMLLGWSLLVGPQLLRQDLRQDLRVADILKMYPMRGWQIVLRELLAPAVILTGIQWILLIIALGLFAGSGGGGKWAAAGLGLGFGAAIIMPMLNLITLQTPNAAVLLFPAWFQTGKEGPQGVEATGQRLIGLLGQLVVLSVALAPAAAAFAAVFFLVRLVLGLALALALASVATAILLAGEAALGLMLLGRLFDRFDVSAELDSSAL